MCCSLAGECGDATNWFEAPILFSGIAEVVLQSPCPTNEEAAALRYKFAMNNFVLTIKLSFYKIEVVMN